jgi:hypothetical protein
MAAPPLGVWGCSLAAGGAHVPHALTFSHVIVMGRDLVATDSGTKITMMPGATYIPSAQTGSVSGIRELTLNRASTRAYAVAAVPATGQAMVTAFNIESGSLQLLNSVRWLCQYAWMPARDHVCILLPGCSYHFLVTFLSLQFGRTGLPPYSACTGRDTSETKPPCS